MRFLVFLFVFSWAATAWSESTINARVVPASVEEGGTLNYELTLSTTSDGDIELTANPDFGSLRILQRTTMPSFVGINGRGQRSVTFRWMLHAPTQGEYQISGAMGRIGTEVFEPETASFTVTPKGSTPKKKATKSDQVFVVGEILPNRKHFVGEQITLNYQLYFDTRLRDIQPHPPDEPPLDEFWVEDMSQHVSSRQTVALDGRRMLKAALRSFALFPLRAGKVNIPPLSLPVVQGGFFNRDEIRIESESIDLDIQPLPSGAPTGFHEGNVGQWKFEVTTDSPISKVGSTVKVRLVVRGYGLPSRLRLPDFPEPQGTRKLESLDKNNKEIHNMRVRGERIVEVPLLLLEEGSIEIPPVAFSWFDPQTATYHTHTTDPIQVAVAPGIAPLEIKEIAPSETRSKSKGDDPTVSLLASLTAPRQDPGSNQPFSRSLWWQLLVLILFATSGFLLIEPTIRNLQAKAAPKRERRRKKKILLNDLKESDSPESLAAAIRNFLLEIVGVSKGLLSPHRIESALEKADFKSEDASFLGQTLKECDVERFDPNYQIDQSFRSKRDRALQILSKVAALLLVLVTTSLPKIAHANGLEAYQNGDFEIALKHFVEQASDSAVAHHNLALANARLERWGLARHHIEIAHLKAPFDSSIAQDQEVISRVIRMRAIQETRVGRIIDGDDQLFWWKSISMLSEDLLAFALLVALTLCVFGLVRRRKGRGSSVAVVGALLTLLILAVWAVRAGVQEQVDAAVIIAKSPTLKEGPTDHANERKDVKGIVDGTMLRVVERRGGWVKLALGESDSAWVRSNELAFPSLILKGR